MLLALTIAAGYGAEPVPPPAPGEPAIEDRIRRHRTAGTAALVGGGAAAAGGFVVLLVGRGRPGEVSTESQVESDVRSIGGSVLVIGGLTLGLVGGSQIGKARALAEQQVAVAPAVVPGGGGLAVAARF